MKLNEHIFHTIINRADNIYLKFKAEKQNLSIEEFINNTPKQNLPRINSDQLIATIWAISDYLSELEIEFKKENIMWK